MERRASTREHERASAPGERPLAPPLSRDAAKARLDAYERSVRAALINREGPARPPVLQLGEGPLRLLFAPRQLESFVERPLDRAAPDC